MGKMDSNSKLVNSRFSFSLDRSELPEQPKSTYERGFRFYITPQGRKYPSVTTVVGYKKNKFFEEWRKNNPEESKRVTDRGNMLHTLIETYLRNEWDGNLSAGDLNEYNQLTNAYNLFCMIRSDLDSSLNRIRCLEHGLYSDSMQLAGRVDCIAEWNRVPSVVDFKGSTKAKQKEEIDNYFAQSAAYSIMWQELTGEILPQIVVIICCEDGTKRIFVERTKNWIPVLFDFCSDFKKISISSAQR